MSDPWNDILKSAERTTENLSRTLSIYGEPEAPKPAPVLMMETVEKAFREADLTTIRKAFWELSSVVQNLANRLDQKAIPADIFANVAQMGNAVAKAEAAADETARISAFLSERMDQIAKSDLALSLQKRDVEDRIAKAEALLEELRVEKAALVEFRKDLIEAARTIARGEAAACLRMHLRESA